MYLHNQLVRGVEVPASLSAVGAPGHERDGVRATVPPGPVGPRRSITTADIRRARALRFERLAALDTFSSSF